jgi:hypothetical protein
LVQEVELISLYLGKILSLICKIRNRREKMNNDSILYFPSIEFRSDEWVKSSLLLWDKIYRIVPKDYTPNDSRTVREAQDNDLIRNIIIEKEDVSIAGDNFLKFISHRPFLPSGLESADEYLIHEDKIDKKLYPLLENISQKYDKQWFKFSRELARGYMFYLSDIMAKRRNLLRATDDHNSWTVMPYFSEDGNFSDNTYNEEAAGFYSSLIINDLIPANLSEVSIVKIIDFVQRRKDLKGTFRKSIGEFTDKLSKCDSLEFTKQLVWDYEKEIQNSKNELRKSMDFCNKDDISTVLTMGVPVSLTAFGAFAVGGSPFDLYKVFGSILIGAVASYFDYNKTKRQYSRNPLATYLIEMDKELLKKKAYPNYPYLFDQFIND